MKWLNVILLFLLAGCAEWMLPVDFMGPVVAPHATAPQPVRLKPIPFSELDFKIDRKPGQIKIAISAKGWRIEGFGVGSNDHEITIHSVAGVRDPLAGPKDYVETCTPGRKITVAFLPPYGNKRIIGTY